MSTDNSSKPDNANDECVGPQHENAGKASSCAGCPNQSECASGAGKQEQVDPAIQEVAERLRDVKHVILVLSGKGGVGKSTVSSQLAWTLNHRGYQVGILDIDICGPSVARMMGVEDYEVRKSNYGWSPVYTDQQSSTDDDSADVNNVAVMSIAFMLGSKTDAVIWRGPRKNGLIKEFLTGVHWDKLDFLIIDSPPGTSDEHLSIVSYLKAVDIDGAIIVTTPQEVALLDVRKEINFCKKTKIPILGVVENMSGFVCPSCQHHTNIFTGTTGGASKMATDMDVNMLGTIPLDTNMLKSCEEGRCFVQAYQTSAAVQPFNSMVDAVLHSNDRLRDTAAEHTSKHQAVATDHAVQSNIKSNNANGVVPRSDASSVIQSLQQQIQQLQQELHRYKLHHAATKQAEDLELKRNEDGVTSA